jgi:hypothetical protein
MAGNWISKAIKHPGTLTKKAHAAGESTSEYMQSTQGKSPQTKRQINLAKVLRKLRKK